MAVSQNTCYEVVNISWLNSLVGNAVQDSNGNTVNVNQTKSGTTYCPTYKQLTDGTFIPYRSESSDGPASDVDGITVNRKCHATGENYADNQLVNKHDVAVCNTRLNSFTISIANASTAFDGCTGGTKNLSYTRTFTRNTWDMLSCSTQTESSHSTASTADTRDSLITWRTSVGSISNQVLTVGKNTPSSTGGSSSRTITVSGSSTFHGTVTTATASTTQGGVSGEYKYWKEQEIDATNYRVVCTGTGSTFGCAGGSYSAAAKHDYKVETFYRWRDVCGTNYDSWSYSTTGDTQTKTDYSYSNSFSDITSTGGENSDSWSKEGYEGSCSWSQSCAAPVTTYTYGTGSTESSTTCDGGSMTLSASNIPYTATTTYGDGHSEVTDTGTITGSATVTIPACYETTGCSPSDTVEASPHGYITYTVSQTGCSDPVTAYTYGTGTVETSTSCAGGSITLTSDNIPYTATTQSGSQPTGTTAGTVTVTISECTDTGGCTTGPTTVDATTPSGAKITYTVTQTGCSPACTCDSLTVTAGSAGAAAGGNLTIGSYAGDCLTSVSASTTATWISSLKVNSDKTISGTVTANSAVDARTATIKVTATECTEGKTFTYTQNGQGCTCSNLTVTAGSAGAAAGGNLTIGSYAGDCLTSVSASTTATWISSLKVNSNKTISGTVTANSAVGARTATIKVTAAECTEGKTFTYTQDGVGCTCDSLTVTAGSAGAAAGGDLTLGTYAGDCLTSVAASESVDWISSIGISGKNITGTVAANSAVGARTATIKVTAAECSAGKTFTYTQDGVGCNCDSLTVTAGSAGAAAGGDLTLGTYAGDCLTNVAASESVDWISSIGISGKNITGTVTANSSVSARTATIKVTASECSTGKTFTYTQNGITCDCNNVTWSGTEEADPT